MVSSTEDHRRQESDTIVSALNDQALRVVNPVIGNPQELLTKLDVRYGSNFTASKIAKVSEYQHVGANEPYERTGRATKVNGHDERRLLLN